MYQGDFHHWVQLFNHFDAYFEEHVKPRKDIQLKLENDAPDPEFPVQNCLEILRVTSILLENCTNKQLYQSYEVRMSAMQPQTLVLKTFT